MIGNDEVAMIVVFVEVALFGVVDAISAEDCPRELELETGEVFSVDVDVEVLEILSVVVSVSVV
jgi:hypothetical protein